MANVNIKFNGKEFLLSCDDGQEEHLEELLIQLNKKDGKINVGLYISIDLINEELNAKIIISHIAEQISGSGGGQPHFAVAGGTNLNGFRESSNYITEILKKG